MKQIKNNLFIVIFLSIIFGLGILSQKKLADFYIYQLRDYNEWTPKLGSKFETDIASTFFQKFGFVNLNGAISNALHQPSMNGIYKLKNGHLFEPQPKLSNEYISQYANEVIKYADYCKSQGTPVLFVQPFLKVDENNKQLPLGVTDFSNENVDYYLECLEDAKIPTLDLRQSLLNDGLDLYDYTYVTDHHWTTEGCFYAFTKVVDSIDSMTGTTTNPVITDMSQYRIETYPRWHLGSYGQRVGKYYAGIDDYDLIIPTYDVSFTDDSGNSHSFYESVVNTDILSSCDVTSRYTYDRAMRCPNDKSSTCHDLKVLFITDSYATAMAPYLKLAYSDYYYQYYPDGFNAEAFNQIQPDIVILMPFYTSIFYPDAVFK